MDGRAEEIGREGKVRYGKGRYHGVSKPDTDLRLCFDRRAF